MATNVDGTIHIIAEVMGDAASTLSGTGSHTGYYKSTKKLGFTIFGMAMDIKGILKLVGLAGLLSQ